MESQMTPSHLTLGDHEGQSQGHSDFEDIFCEGAKLGHKLLLNINGKAYIGSQKTLAR